MSDIIFQINDQGQMISPGNFCEYVSDLSGIHGVSLHEIKTYSPEDNSISIFFDAVNFFNLSDGTFIRVSHLKKFTAISLQYQGQNYTMAYISSQHYNTPDKSFHRVELMFSKPSFDD